MKSFFLLTYLLITVSWAQSPRVAPPNSINQNSRVNQAQNNNPFLPDVPDPYAIHTQKGTNFEQPAMGSDEISIMYFQLTGKRVLPNQAASGVEIKIVQPGPLTNQDVIDLIETKLSMEGFSLISVPEHPRQLRLLPTANGTQLTRLITDAAQLPNNDEVVRYEMRMNHLKPEEAAQVFQSVIGQFGPGSSIVPIPSSGKILITDNALLIKSLLQIKKQIDVPSTSANTRFVSLVYADAEEIANTLNELVNDEDNSNVRNNNNRGGNGQNLPNSPANNGAGAVEEVPLKILSDTRTNRVILLGSPSKISFAEALIKQLDRPTPSGNSLRRRLKYLPVTDFMPIAVSSIEATLSSSTGAGGSTSTANPNQPARNNQANNNNPNTGAAGGGGGTASVGGQDGATAPTSQLIGKTLIVSDNISNSIIVNGPPHHIEIVQNLIDELDIHSAQIAITAVFGRYGSTDERTFDSELAALFNNAGGPEFGGGTSNVTGVFDAADLATFATSALSNGLVLGFADSDFGVFLNATRQMSNFQSFSRPTIFTTNNRSARISSGSRIAVPTGSVSGTTGVASTQIDFRDVALDLEIRPLVNGDDEITLDIALVNDTVGTLRDIGDVSINDIISEELNTVITIKDRSLIVLGGLYTTEISEAEIKVPILGDIPLLGKLFTNTNDDNDATELVIMVYAHIVNSPSEINEFQNDFDRKSFIAPHARENFYSNSLLAEPEKKKRSWWNKKKYGKKSGLNKTQPAQPTAPVNVQYSDSTINSFHHDRLGN